MPTRNFMGDEYTVEEVLQEIAGLIKSQNSILDRIAGALEGRKKDKELDFAQDKEAEIRNEERARAAAEIARQIARAEQLMVNVRMSELDRQRRMKKRWWQRVTKPEEEQR